MLDTARLTLIPATVELARAELRDPEEFARLLGSEVPENWPPESVTDALPLFLEWLEAAPTRVGWFGWYALLRGAQVGEMTLVGGGGFLGPPAEHCVQMGYSVLPQFQRRGYATEMVKGLIGWAFAAGAVTTIRAETEWENPASTRVLAKAGFRNLGSNSEPGGVRFELTPADYLA